MIAYGLSYAADTILLSLFAALDTVPAWIPIAYGATGLIVCAGFYGLIRSGASERLRDPHLTILQTFSSCAVLLVFLGLAPQVGALFLSILLVVVGFGSLRLSWREALVSCLVIAAGTGVALHYGPGVSWFPSSTIAERSLVWVWYLLILARLMGLGLVGNGMRVKLVKRGRQLTESIRALEARTEELRVAMAAAESASRAKSQFLANFTIRAEVVEGEQPAAPRAQEADATDCRGARVLLAEDNPVNRLVARAALENAGCRVTLAADGRAAVEAWLGQPFNLVIMDCQMPELDGFEATREIRLREAGAGVRTPIVALTANAMKGDRERCVAAGMDDYLAKPFRRGELAAVLRRWIDLTAPPRTAETAAPLGAESRAPAQADAPTTDAPRQPSPPAP